MIEPPINKHQNNGSKHVRQIFSNLYVSADKST